MATAVAASASAEAAKKLITIHPPASPFAELLRRSRFASYDPAIRQTYSSPPAHAHRGDWGLKRPISLRRKNAFISLTSFEHPAQFIEWNHAENQVRFIRRIEEMGVKPETMSATGWYKGLGKAKTEWLLDSEFCPGEGHETGIQRPAENVNLATLGQRGPGAYGAQRESIAPESYVTPNVDAMSRKEFAQYLRKLRELRPAFQAHLKDEHRKHGTDTNKPLYDLAQRPEGAYHRRFLKQQLADEYNDVFSHKMEQHPHPSAALTYTHPSPLESVLQAKPQPGIVLNPVYTKAAQQGSERPYVASFGGLAATLKYGQAGGKRPLLDVGSDEGINKSHIDNSIADMRVSLKRGLRLQMPPKVVGRHAQGLKAVKIAAEVTTASREKDFSRDNPHLPGSPAYIAADPWSAAKSAPLSFVKRQSPRLFVQTPKLPTVSEDGLLTTLQGIIKTNSGVGDAGSASGL
ncbi:hypothetical protein Hypma_010665 [Hypsizygus marmoreus]|uniref:Uncharacterized protein n=1 Tax=Hypsizygus marmoreus TaxID=39966 RepID=A0A369JK84_HYPMA|nr:hypothetical protein Hypma_010665 [Hypsizygus marmoreus]